MKIPSWFPSYQPAVEHELFVLGYRNLPVHSVGQACLSALVAAGAWGVAPHRILLTWIGWVTLSVVALLLGAWLFRHAAAEKLPRVAALRQWRWVHPLLLSMVGLSWGTAALLMTPAAPVHNLMIMIAFTGALAYSAMSNAPHDPIAFGVSATLAVAMMLWQLPAAFGAHAWFISGMTVLYS